MPLALGASPAAARITVSDTARTYVEARAAAMSGDHARAAQLLAALAEAEPDQADLARKALSEAIGAGRHASWRCASRGRFPRRKLPTDARLLLVTEEIAPAASGAGGAVARRKPATTATSRFLRR